jgi:hypothetical protein
MMETVGGIPFQAMSIRLVSVKTVGSYPPKQADIFGLTSRSRSTIYFSVPSPIGTDFTTMLAGFSRPAVGE